MKTVLAIAAKDIKEAFRNRSTYIYIAFLFLISFPTLEGLRAAFLRAGQGASEAALELASRAFLRATVSTLPLTLTMLFCTYLSAYAIVLEKAKRTLESLLATPASLRQVWMGKTLAVAVPSVVATVLVLIVAVIVLNVGVIAPRTGSFVLPDVISLITGLVLVPLLAFEVVAAVSVLQLIVSNPRVANFAFVAVFFGFYLMTVTQVAVYWDFSLIYAAVLVVMAAVNLALSHLLTKERVILSSKA